MMTPNVLNDLTMPLKKCINQNGNMRANCDACKIMRFILSLEFESKHTILNFVVVDRLNEICGLT